jgi:CHAT domain-containing protein
MRSLLPFFLLGISFQVAAQTADKTLDSLIASANAYLAQTKPAEAIKVIKTAEAHAMANFGNNSLELAECYKAHASFLKADGKYESAIERFERECAIYKQQFGPFSAKYLDACHGLGKIHCDFAYSKPALDSSVLLKAIDFFQIVIQAYPQADIRDSLVYHRALYNCARQYRNLGDSESEERLLIELASIPSVQQAGGNAFKMSCQALAEIYWQRNQFQKCIPWLLKKREAILKTLGANHWEYAENTDDLSKAYGMVENYELAIKYSLEYQASSLQIYGRLSQQHANALNSLAVRYQEISQYEKSQPLMEESLEIMRAISGENTAAYAIGLNGAANNYLALGEYEKAEEYLEKACVISAQTDGKTSFLYAVKTADLASLYITLGNYKKAIEMYRSILPIIADGPQKWVYPALMENMSTGYLGLEDYVKADSFTRLALSLKETVIGIQDLEYAKSLQNLGRLQLFQGQLLESKATLTRSRDIAAAISGTQSDVYADQIHNLARVLSRMGDHTQARELFLQAGIIFKKTKGVNNQEYLANLRYHALTCNIAGLYAAADSLLQEAQMVEQTCLLNGIRHLSEREISNYVSVFSNVLSQYYSFAIWDTLNVGKRPLAGIFYNGELFYKNLLRERGIRARLNQIPPSQQREEGVQLLACYRRLANIYAQPDEGQDSLRSSLETTVNQLEKKLAKTLLVNPYSPIQYQDVQNSLTPGAAAIEFISFRYHRPERSTDTILYAALVLLPNGKEPQFVPLCQETSLTKLLSLGQENTYFYNQRTPSSNLYHLLWRPLDSLLSGCHTIYYANSGLLHRINLTALPFERGKYLGDRYKMIALSSTRQLANKQRESPFQEQGILVFGGINYEMDSVQYRSAFLNSSLRPTTNEPETTENLYTPSLSEMRGARLPDEAWTALPYTRIEAEQIAKIAETAKIPTVLLTGYAASEEAFKTLGHNEPSPKILHLATHGFFFEMPEGATPQQQGFQDEFGASFANNSNPMMRSGLVMAGANHTWRNRVGLQHFEDGVLTAYEISQTNLSNTEVVVLSACESGLGDIHTFEGVFGLQRAFKIAGAKYIIMSLWEADDEKTQQLMSEFYQLYLVEKLPVKQAFDQAVQRLRERHPKPFYWAGFVLVE